MWKEYEKKYRESAKNNEMSPSIIEENLAYAKDLFDNNLPIIYDINHFSQLVGLEKDLILSMAYSKEKFYRTFYITKNSGGKREINEPLPMLKEVQRWILYNILINIKVSPYAKAYLPNKNVKENVRFHKRQSYILKLDIENFFGNIHSKLIWEFFYSLGYKRNVVSLFTNLVTLKGSLPQGASTSPALSNIILRQFDEEVAKKIKGNDIRYTRYADDLTFSGELNKQKIINFCRKKLKKYNLNLNDKKIRVLKKHNRQIITGIVVNEKVQIDRKKRQEYRKLTYYIKKYGVINHLKKIGKDISPETYLLSLKGKIEFGIFINPYDDKLNECLKIVKDELIKIDH